MSIAALFDTQEEEESSRWFGGYRILNRIAEGGTAYVFRAEDPQTGDAVALKTVRSGVSLEIAVLAREIEVLRALHHPGVVRFVADGICEGLPWMAVELLEGRTLFAEISRIWDRERRLHDRRLGPRASADRRRETLVTVRLPPQQQDSAPSRGSWLFSMHSDPLLAFPARRAAAGCLPEVLTRIKQLLPALDYIHSRGIVHGDVKPPNVHLSHDGRVTLLDFGLAHAPRKGRDAFTVNGLRMGTTQYAAPEQITGEKFDTTADIYSLGCVLYELVTGRIPFDGESLEDIARRQVNEEPMCPSLLVSGLPWALEDLIMTMLAKRPSRRPRSAREVAAGLNRVLPGCQQM